MTSRKPQQHPLQQQPTSEDGMCAERLERVGAWMEKMVVEGKLPCACVSVLRGNKEVYSHMCGFRNVEDKVPVTEDTLFRIYSMTKAVTCVALMSLYEEGHFELTDPVSKFIPCFSDMKVAVGGSYPDFELEDARSPITIQQLFTHTSGLTYWFFDDELGVNKAYKEKKVMFSPLFPNEHDGMDLEKMCERLASCPLLFHPGTKWQYSNATDVLGRLVEVISGQRLDTFMQERIFTPLDMRDTAFHVAAEHVDRFARCYTVKRSEEDAKKGALLSGAGFQFQGFERLDNDALFMSPPNVYAGGGGLVSTLRDYTRFCRMLLNNGVLDGKRVLGRKTVEFMMLNHLNGDMADYGMPSWLNMNRHGVGFGLGWAVVVDPARLGAMCSAGEVAWGGMASTFFWIDPREDMACVFMTQLVPSSALPLRRTLRYLVNAAIE
ncbi:beta-lactamase [Salpingoeca rosetta]|uniref:Beta-lactamase n=1 Tax=Salpingoeca rosetta (strain ATCC 50818 / BSB-021) TaxID=946362 RepID=F2UQZ5_SALR5|nr:beta-lactamase [Salpingoeca rosetta]EGD80050.1 beta-lactamase [Salpingoeca rosetta]|eukprot:XP_004988375.1 beta-lactamase [Salpingoeca rosetta]